VLAGPRGAGRRPLRLFNRRRGPDFAYWTSRRRSDHDVLGGNGHVRRPGHRCAGADPLNQQIVATTEYWPSCSHRARGSCSSPSRGIAGAIGAMARLRPLLEVRDVRKSFGGFQAVAGVSLMVNARDGGDHRTTAPADHVLHLITGHPASRTRAPCCSRPRHHGGAPRRLPPRQDGSFQRPTYFPGSRFLQNVQAAYLSHRGRGRDLWSSVERLYRDRDRGRLASIGLLERSGELAFLSPGARSSSSWASRWPASRAPCCSTSPRPACRATETRDTIRSSSDRICPRPRPHPALLTEPQNSGRGVLDRARRITGVSIRPGDRGRRSGRRARRSWYQSGASISERGDSTAAVLDGWGGGGGGGVTIHDGLWASRCSSVRVARRGLAVSACACSEP